MRKLAIALATTAAVAASPAMARDGAWYVGGDFGAMIVEDTDFDVNSVDDQVTVDYDYGYDGSLFAGYDLGSFRIEAEAAYKKADLEEIDSAIVLPGGAPVGLRDAGGGSTKALSFMVNGLFDFGDDDGISGFVGGGVGWAKVKHSDLRTFANGPAFLDDSDGALAWQVVAGVRQAVSDNVDVTVRYRFFNTTGLDFTNGADEFGGKFRSHSLLGGITFNFGAPPPPPPPPPPPRAAPPPPPPPPPPPQMRDCPDGSRVPVTAACPAPPPPPPAPRAGERG